MLMRRQTPAAPYLLSPHYDDLHLFLLLARHHRQSHGVYGDDFGAGRAVADWLASRALDCAGRRKSGHGMRATSIDPSSFPLIQLSAVLPGGSDRRLASLGTVEVHEDGPRHAEIMCAWDAWCVLPRQYRGLEVTLLPRRWHCRFGCGHPSP